LWIRIDESGKQNSFLALRREAPQDLSDAFAGAMGCRASDLVTEQGRSYRPEVNCSLASTRSGLKTTSQWPLSRLNPLLANAGITNLEVYINHSGHGTVRVTPQMESTHGIFGWSHQWTVPVEKLQDIELTTGFEESAAWLLFLGALGTGLSPLLLAGVRGGLPTIHAAVRWTGILVGTAWLWILLFTDGPGLVALAASDFAVPRLVLTAAVILVPMLVAVCLGCFILGPKYRKVLPAALAARRQKLMLSGGIAAAGMLCAIVGMLSGGDGIFSLSITGLLIFLAGILQRYRNATASFTPLGEGPLLDRIRQLAATAGTQVKTVKLIRSEFDTPAAFADHRGGILLSLGLLRQLSRREVDAIVAHELSHLRRSHGAQMRGWLMVLPVAIAASFLVPGFVLWAALLLPMCFLTFMAVRRNQELTADADAARWTGGPEALILGLARATQGTPAPLNWGRWAGLVLPHPPTLERLHALGAKAGVSPDRVEEIVASAGIPPEARYELPELADSSNVAQGSQRRTHLRLLLGWVGLVFPIAYSVLIPMAVPTSGLSWPVVAAAELVFGMVLFYLLYEWMVTRARSGVREARRTQLATEGVTEPGFFAGFSPSSEPSLYEGMYDFEWAFVAFQGDQMILRGEKGSFSAKRKDVARIWLHTGPVSWTPRPMVSFELAPVAEGDAPRSFSIRPFDSAFGLMASGAARNLLQAAHAWHLGNAGGPPPLPVTTLYQYPVQAGQIDAPYSFFLMMKTLMQFSSYAVAGAGILQFYVQNQWQPGTLLTTLLLVWGLVIFQAWPAIRRSS